MTEATAGSGAIGPGRGGRMSRQRKAAAVVRLLRGEDLETVSRSLGVIPNPSDQFAGDAAGSAVGHHS